MPCDFAVAQLGLGLAFELRVGELDADDGGQAFADVVAAHRLGSSSLSSLLFFAYCVDRAGQGRPEAAEVRAALDGVDVVGVGRNVLGVSCRCTACAISTTMLVLLLLEVDDLGVERRSCSCSGARRTPRCRPCSMNSFFARRLLLLELDLDALVQERQFAQAVGQDVVLELDDLENRAVGHEGDLGARCSWSCRSSPAW